MDFNDKFLTRAHDLSGADANYITDNLREVGIATIKVSSDKDFAAGATKPTVKIKVINTESIIAINSTPTAGGTGYSVGDVLTLTEGLIGTVTVTAVTAGVVDTVSLRSGGVNYTVGTGKVATGGAGTGCTIEITHAANFVEITDLLVTVTAANETHTRVLPDFEAKYIRCDVEKNDGTAGNLAIHYLGKR